MLKQFIQLEWRAFTRASNFKAHLALKIILGVLGVIYAFAFLFVGIASYMGLRESGLQPMHEMSKYLIYYFAADLFVRFYMQKSPVLNIRPLLIQGVKRSTIVSFALGKTFVSFFTWIGAVFWVPFTITALLYEENKIGVLAWFVMIWMLVYCLNLFNQLLNDANKWILVFAAVIIIVFTLDFYDYFSLSEILGPVFEAFITYPLLVVLPIALFVGLLFYTKNHYIKRLYLDQGLAVVSEKAKEINLPILERMGFIGTLVKNDLYLLWRNKRSKNTIFMSFAFLFYGLLFFSNFGIETYGENSAMQIFAGIFVTGGFLFLFGQFVPSWDSSYYPLMMTQKIPYRTFLEAKWWLMVAVTLLMTVFSTFYWVLYGWDVFKIILAGTVFNIGMNTHLVLLSGAFIKTPIDLTKTQGAFGDKQSFNITTVLLSLPKLLLPILIYGIGTWTGNPNLGLFLVVVVGIIGFFGRNYIFNQILILYKKRKYETLEAYKQKG